MKTKTKKKLTLLLISLSALICMVLFSLTNAIAETAPNHDAIFDLSKGSKVYNGNTYGDDAAFKALYQLNKIQDTVSPNDCDFAFKNKDGKLIIKVDRDPESSSDIYYAVEGLTELDNISYVLTDADRAVLKDKFAWNADDAGNIRSATLILSGTKPDGWIFRAGKWYYYKNGVKQLHWQYINNNWYFLGDDGIMQTGWIEQGSTWYYLRSSGAMSTGWAEVNKTWYFFNGNGAMATGWLQQGSTWYYLKSSGAMSTGWAEVNKTWYFFNGSGAMATGWLQQGSTWYLLQSSGAMATGLTQYSSKWHYFNSSGALISSDNGYIRANVKSMIYHVPGGRFYNKIAQENLIKFDSEQDAVSAGFRKSLV